MADQQYITFNLNDDIFGINILLVREINRNLDITPVDRSPSYVRGLLNLRGQIITVMDLGIRLGLAPRETLRTSCCIVLKTTSELERSNAPEELLKSTSPDLVGLFVDRIGDVVTVDSEQIEPPSTHSSGVASRFLEGVIKLEKKLLITLKTSEVLAFDHAATQ